jgi:PAS domain S-box-containing protein
MGTTAHALHHPSYTLSLVDQKGNVQYQSSAVEALLGYKPEEMAGSAWFSFVHTEDAQPVQSQFDEMVNRGGEQARWILRFRAARGGWQPVEVRARNLLADPDVRGILLSLRAVGARPATREEVRT